jgi:hypothetical protein
VGVDFQLTRKPSMPAASPAHVLAHHASSSLE